MPCTVRSLAMLGNVYQAARNANCCAEHSSASSRDLGSHNNNNHNTTTTATTTTTTQQPQQQQPEGAGGKLLAPILAPVDCLSAYEYRSCCWESTATATSTSTATATLFKLGQTVKDIPACRRFPSLSPPHPHLFAVSNWGRSTVCCLFCCM